MKAITESIYERGKHGNKYVRRRIPAALRAAYPPNKADIVVSLGTTDLREAKVRAHVVQARIDAEFQAKRQQLELSRASLAAKRIAKLDDEQLRGAAKFWVHQVLLSDERRRQQGLDDFEFDELGLQLETQRAELGRMLAQGKSLGIFPALHGFLYLCGLDFDPAQDEAKRASYIFLRSVVETLDLQLGRQRGDVVDVEVVAPAVSHPLQAVVPERAPDNPNSPTWDKVFDTWRDYVENRPKPTTIASQTAWRDLRRFAATKGVRVPVDVTPELMTGFAEDMRSRLEVPTINDRIAKVRAIYRIAVGKHLLKENPAANTLGFKENGVKKRKKRRLPFSAEDLTTLFGSEVFVEHSRSQGQSGEASYWIPLLMFYSGARPEELAGLALSDLGQDADGAWYLNIIDRPCGDDVDLFDDDEVPESHRRTLKNQMSIRRVPLAKELLDLGLLRYVEWLQGQGAVVLFPTLKKDFHGKLCGAFSKFFGRYKRSLGITDNRKVLYSFRHCMKDALEAAGVPTKYLQRLLGHTTGDGVITDGYGSDLPFERLAGYFRQIKFQPIPAQPWQPGRGSVRLKK